MIALLFIPILCISIAYAVFGNSRKIFDFIAWMVVSNVAGFFVLTALMEDKFADLYILNALRLFFLASFLIVAFQGRYFKMPELEISFNSAIATLILALIIYIVLTLLMPSYITIGKNIIGTKNLLGMI